MVVTFARIQVLGSEIDSRTRNASDLVSRKGIEYSLFCSDAELELCIQELLDFNLFLMEKTICCIQLHY